MNLTELQKADPETWAAIMQWKAHDNVYDPVLWGYVIQGELQRAIEKRGWSYQLAYQPHIGPDDRHFHAFIWVDQNAFRGDGDSHAEALLAAYLGVIHES